MWLIYSLIATFAWALEEVCLKVGNTTDEIGSEYKTSVWLGICMFIAHIALLSLSDTSLINLITSNLIIVGIVAFYCVCLLIDFVSYKYLDMAITTSICNAGGIIATFFFVIYYLFIGNIQLLQESLTVCNTAALILITASISLLAYIQHKIHKGEIVVKNINTRSALMYLLPTVYIIGEGLNTFFCGIAVTEVLSPIDYNILFTFVMSAFGIVCWFKLLLVNNIVYNPFKKTELPKIYTAVLECIAKMTYVYAMEINPIVAGPLTSTYPVVAVGFSYSYLKENILKTQWACIILIIITTLILAINEGLV